MRKFFDHWYGSEWVSLEVDKLAENFASSFYYTEEKNKPAHPYYPGGPVLHQTHGSGWLVGVVVEEMMPGEGPVETDALRWLAVAVADEDDDDDDEFMGEALVWGDEGVGLELFSV